jgi:hypothetical protein
MQHTNVRMIQARDGLGFALKPLLANCVRGELRGQNLDGDSAFQPRVAGAVDFAHAACAQRLRDFIGAQVRAWS